MQKQILSTTTLILLIAINLFAANPGDIVINELMWMGSTSSTADEWIELRNMTSNPIDLTGWQLTRKSSGAEILMLEIPSGTIPANGYFLISNYNAANSKINVTPDLVDTGVSLANTQLQIKLYDGQWDGSSSLIDTADDGSGAPLVGDNSNKYSMMRTEPPGDGTQASNWFTADLADGWDAGATEKGTPGSSNFAAGPLNHFDIDNITNQKVGVAFPITVTAKDASGVTVFVFNGTVDISDLTGTITPTMSGNFSSGSWTDNVTISQEKTGNVIAVTNSSGTETGQSNSFDVTVGSGAGNVIINELMWMGSTSSTADEWIELKNSTNNTIDLSGWQLTRKSSGSEALMLEIPSGTILANGYFLISNYNETNSQIAITPDLIETAVSLANTQLQIKLYDGQWDGNGNLIDTADDGIGAAAAGDNTNKYSMMRTDPPGDGTLGTNWYTADKAFGWDAAATELGSPGFSNDGLDFGDLPSSYSLTSSINNSARHNIGDTYLGTAIDSETDGQESADAGRAATDGDDGADTDDEDGVTVNGDWLEGTNGGAVDVSVSGGSGYLSGWIDWDNNNNFTDTGDQVFNMKQVVAGAQTIQFDIPNGAIPSSGTYNRFARFRLSPASTPVMITTGLLNNGEVEDFYLQFDGIVVPIVTTNAASTVGATNATLNGTVNANGSSTTVTFEYGTTTAYGTTVTADQSPVTGSANTAVSKTITGLTNNTTYHYRAVGVNAEGSTNGGDMTFTTGSGTDTDGDGVSDIDEGTSDRDGDTIPNDEDYDPSGWIYDETNGNIISSGTISVSPSANVNIIQDGSNGYYQFTVSQNGDYTLSYNPPAGFILSSACTAQTGPMDPSPTDPNPKVVGNDSKDGTTNKMTSDWSCGDNPYYWNFHLELGDPVIINNNIPLNPQPTNIVLSSFIAVVKENGVLISWTTETEPDNAGFNAYRSQQENSEFMKINENMIPALGNATTGASYSYPDNPQQAGSYYYKLQAVSLTGDTSFHGPISIILTKVNLQKNKITTEYSLSQNYPNPFNPETTIEFGLAASGFVEITIYDINGKLVRTLVSEEKRARNHWVKWNARDENGVRVSSGIYFYYFKSVEFSQTMKMILMK